MVKRLILAAMLVAVAGCTTTKGGNFCQISQPIRLSSKTVDSLSDDEAKQLLSYLKKGEKLCGWHP